MCACGNSKYVYELYNDHDIMSRVVYRSLQDNKPETVSKCLSELVRIKDSRRG